MGLLAKLIRLIRKDPFPLEPLGFEPVRDTPETPVAKPFAVKMYNDDKTAMEFVVNILRVYLGMGEKEAIDAMLKVHMEGSTLLGRFDRASAEQMVACIGREAARYGFPLRCEAVSDVVD